MAMVSLSAESLDFPGEGWNSFPDKGFPMGASDRGFMVKVWVGFRGEVVSATGAGSFHDHQDNLPRGQWRREGRGLWSKNFLEKILKVGHCNSPKVSSQDSSFPESVYFSGTWYVQ